MRNPEAVFVCLELVAKQVHLNLMIPLHHHQRHLIRQCATPLVKPPLCASVLMQPCAAAKGRVLKQTITIIWQNIQTQAVVPSSLQLFHNPAILSLVFQQIKIP